MTRSEQTALWSGLAGQGEAGAGGDAGASARPRLRFVDRAQVQMRVVDVERLIEEDHPARAIWEFVGKLDLSEYEWEIRAVEGKAGRTAYDPRLLISLWVYGYSRGVGSARAIARLCETEPAYQWLTGMEPISGHTLSDFRVGHEEALKDLFTQVLGLLSAEGLVTLQRVMQDGTKIRASASADSFRSGSRIEEKLKLAREHVEAVAAEGEEEASLQMVRARERARRERQERLATALAEWEGLQEEKADADRRVSVTDPDARVMKQPDGGYAPSYNVQITTDAAEQVVVGVAMTQDGNDSGQLMPALERLEETLGVMPAQVVADSAYVTRNNIMATASEGVELIGPAEELDGKAGASYEQRGVGEAYRAEAFIYDEATDSYRCPEGKVLSHRGKRECRSEIMHRYCARWQDCRDCPAKGQCCPGNKKEGRSIQRPESFREVVEFREKMETEEAREIYRQRAQVAETPNLWLKAKFNLRQFHVRGTAKVSMEALWACLTYNIRCWYRLKWRPLRAAAPAVV
jgi:transposase